MRTRLFAASAVLAALLVVVSAPAAWAKPADLPSQNQIECADDPVQGKIEIELNITGHGITLKVGAGLAESADAPAIDALLPAFVEQWLQHMGDVLTQPKRGVSLDALLRRIPYFVPYQTRIEEQPRDANEQGDPAAAFRDMGDRLIPLGLVEVMY